jgi:site-specific DNA-cytosine methylase
MDNGITVLSLFDGISCGQIALNRLKIKIKNYFASEIDKHAIKVTMSNFQNTIQLGSVENIFYINKSLIVTEKQNDKYILKQIYPNVKIDLFMGGSPCQGFSVVGKKLNFKDSRSKLFLHYVRLFRRCDPKVFLLENVKMNKISENIISKLLHVNPILINSALVSMQNRKRLYWSNLNITQPKDKKLYFNKKLFHRGHGYFTEHIKLYKKYPTLMTNNPSCDFKTIGYSPLTPEDCEALQTIDIGHTKSIANGRRFHAIGNAWTVDVICHILKDLKNVLN